MAYEILKALSFGGITVADGGIAGKFLVPSSNEKPLHSKVELTSSSEKPAQKKCVVYVVSGVTTQNSVTKISSITQKVEEESIDSFLSEKGDNFSNDVKSACGGSKARSETDSNLNVYVYQQDQGQRNWIYSVGLQKDWLSDSNVTRDAAS
ncbi:hypothetical protein MHF_1168 [Mycoplasma haemofelis Ohio2]|uniref:Uncharacterized protein n=1 Tax=Mycoplasma haemofelis (strain Ohio2) TaxID=859194 RepID=F6FJQ4_MYCHI|nr:hypothetical protein MHF_1168 [Mycoplasma haemofelis Ohio2]